MSACISIFSYCCTGGLVVHSYGRLIPHEFPITDLQQISGPDGIGRINCTVSIGRARFLRLWPRVPWPLPEAGGLTVNVATTTLVVNPNYKLVNSEWYCEGQQFYLYISGNSEFIPCNTSICSACTGKPIYSFTIYEDVSCMTL